jgi:YD repeat-containing protein
MKTRDKFRRTQVNTIRLVAVICLGIFTTSANAASYTQCMALYGKSLGIPGKSSCAVQTAGTSPSNLGPDDQYNGMYYYNCYNAVDWIGDYCKGVPVPPQPDDTCTVADPVFPNKGIVTLSESDFASGDASPLVFRRYYLSKPYDTAPTTMGRNWTNNWQRRLDFAGIQGKEPHIVAYRDGQQPLVFNLKGNAWVVPGSKWLSLAKAGDGYYYLKDEAAGTTEAYSDSTGMFQSETTRTGMYREVVYNGGLVVGISQWSLEHKQQRGFSMYLSLTYDKSGRVLSVVSPSGDSTHYAYDAQGNLSSLTRPDGFVRQYLYEDTRFPNAITGIKDESGSLTATWTYDGNGRAISVSHPDTNRNVSLTYAPGSTTLQDVSGTSGFSFDTVDTSRPRMISTPSGNISRTWDSSNNLTQKTTPDGNTQYTYDSADRPVKAVASVSGKKVVTTIEYSDASSSRPHLIATPGKIRAFVYDALGNVTGYAEQQTSDTTGESGLQAVAAGDKWTVGAGYDSVGRLSAATVTFNGSKTEDWSYTYDERGNIESTRDAISGWTMRTLERDIANRPQRIAGNTGQASIAYTVRGQVSSFQYSEPASSVNGGLARVLLVTYKYAPDGTQASRTATVSQNGSWPQPITDAELSVWLLNWEAGSDPVAPAANMTGANSKAFVPDICVECYVTWRAKFAGKIFGDELSADVPKWQEPVEVKAVDQAQIPYPVLVADLTESAKRSTLYSTLFGSANDDGGMVKCGGREKNDQKCHDQFEYDQDVCTTLAGPRSKRFLALCRQRAFERYQSCLGY